MDMNSRIGTWALAFLLATAAPTLEPVFSWGFPNQ
jgi:hypothetical protein